MDEGPPRASPHFVMISSLATRMFERSHANFWPASLNGRSRTRVRSAVDMPRGHSMACAFAHVRNMHRRSGSGHGARELRRHLAVDYRLRR